jgi:hypothetical protein
MKFQARKIFKVLRQNPDTKLDKDLPKGIILRQ